MSDDLVLVTGASSYVGAHVVKALQEAGYKVRGSVRGLDNKKKVDFLYSLVPGAKHPVELVEADLLNADTWKEAVKDCQYVIHTASPYPLGQPKKADDVIRPAVDGTTNVLRAVAEAGSVKRVVVTSSFIAMEGREKKEGPITEEDWTVPENIASVYGKSKTLAERAAWDFVKELPQDQKFDLCVINPVMITGPTLHGNFGASVDITQRLMEKKLPMVPQFHFPFVDVRDVAEAHVKCLTKDGVVGHRHLLFSENVYFPDMAKWLETEFKSQGYNIPTRTMPNALLKVVCVFSSDLKIGRDFAMQKKEISNNRFREVLEITPRPIERSVVEMAYSLVEFGIVKKTAQYRGPPQSGATAEAEQTPAEPAGEQQQQES